MYGSLSFGLSLIRQQQPPNKLKYLGLLMQQRSHIFTVPTGREHKPLLKPLKRLFVLKSRQRKEALVLAKKGQ
jgi:hypothetical protein